MLTFKNLGLALCLFSGVAAAEQLQLTLGECAEHTFYREVTVFKDPNLFLAKLNLFAVDPDVGSRELAQESVVKTTLRGIVRLKLGQMEEFPNFRDISQLYAASEPRLSNQGALGKSEAIRWIQFCGSGDPGFILERDFIEATKLPSEQGFGLPPSTRTIPEWPGDGAH